MSPDARKQPIFPLCKLAEYTVTASSTRRRSLVKTQIKQAIEVSEKRRWWYSEAKGEIRKFLRTPAATRQDLFGAANQLRDEAAAEFKESKRKSLLASARAIEAFLPIAESLRSRHVIATAGQRHDAYVRRGSVKVIVAPDILFLERGSEHVVGALNLHASQQFRLGSDALLNAASVLFTYLQEHGDKPANPHCLAVDVFTPAYEAAPARLKRRMQAIEAACEEIEGWWNAMYDRVLTDAQSRRP